MYLDTIFSTAASPRFAFFSGARNESLGSYIPLVEAAVTAQCPEFDPRTLQVAALRNEAKRVQAEAQKRLTEIESQIGKLLALEAA